MRHLVFCMGEFHLTCSCVWIGGTRFEAIEDGVVVTYRDGATRFIANSWYDDIDTDDL